MTSYLVSNLSLRCFIVYMFFISSLKDEPHILSLVFDMLFNEHQHFSLTQRLFVSAPLVMFIYRCTMFCIVFMFEYCHFNFNICISMSKLHKGKIYLCVSSSFFFKFFTLFGSKLKSSLTTFFFYFSQLYKYRERLHHDSPPKILHQNHAQSTYTLLQKVQIPLNG